MIYIGTFRGHSVKILIDCGATGHFVNSSLVKRLKLPSIAKLKHDTIRLADGSVLGSYSMMPNVKFSMGTYADIETFHVADLGDFDVILGKPWLSRVNPAVDWRFDTLKFKHGGAKHTLYPANMIESVDSSKLVMSVMQLKKAVKDTSNQFFFVALKDSIEITELNPAKPSDSPAPAQSEHPQPAPESDPTPDIIQALVDEFKDELSKDVEIPPKRSVELEIPIVPGSPTPCRPMYKHSPAENEEIKRQLQDLLNKGFIRPSSSPYGAPVLLVKKKSGEYRFVIDYRWLNNITLRNRYPLPDIQTLFAQIRGKRYTQLDLRSGYMQIRVSDQDIHKTAFRTRYGSYEFTVMPFGLTGAPGTFSRLMNDIFKPYLDKFVVVYLDDILIYSENDEQHAKHLRLVLELLKQHRLRLNFPKCKFGKSEVEFLGHFVGAQGIRTDPKKVKSIKEWPRPSNVSQLQSFMGLANYYRRFVRDFSAIAAPLTALMAKDVTWQWTSIHEDAFLTLKRALVSAPILATPDFKGDPFTVKCDASGYAIGQVLCQVQDGQERVIAYESRKLNPAELNYPTHDKELLSVMHALRTWRQFLHGKPFLIITDNSATKYIQTKAQLSSRQARWLDLMAEFTFEIKHRPGTENVVADALSRRADYALSCMFMLHAATIQQSRVTVDDAFLDRIRAAAQHDQTYQDILAEVQAGARSDFILKHGLLYRVKFKRVTRASVASPLDSVVIYIPNDVELRESILKEVHDATTSGHMGRYKTLERLAQLFYWPYMDQTVRDYVRTCPTCQRTKPSNQSPAGLLQPLPVPERRWQWVSMDLVTGLPTTKHGYDAIVVFVDMLTRMAHFVPTHTNVTAPALAKLFFEHVFRYHGLPEVIVSDRDPKFTSDFWTELFKLVGTRLNMSTANHPQTDGSSERVIRTLQALLRAYVSPFQDDWDQHLVAVEFAYNDSVHASTGFTPFHLNFGQSPRTPLSMLVTGVSKPKSTESAAQFIQRLAADVELAKQRIQQYKDDMKVYADQHRRDVTFKVGDQVMLSAAHLRNMPKAEHAVRKLSQKFYGPFKITKVVSPVAYQLDLPPTMRIHRVIHVSMLKPYYDGTSSFPGRAGETSPPPPDIVDGEEHHHVSAFLKRRYSGNRLQWLVSWTNFDASHNEWKTDQSLRDELSSDAYDKLVQEYQQSLQHHRGEQR